jgi:hypothetical protein
MAFQMNASGIFQQSHWYIWHIYLITASGCPIFQSLGRKQKSWPYRNSRFPQNLRSISLLSTTGKLLEKVILKTVQRHVEERGLLNVSQFGFRARHSTTLQCVRHTDHVTPNFNNNMSTAAVFLDIEKVSDTKWQSGLLYKLSKLEFSTSLIKLISSFLSKRKFSVSVEGEKSTPREMRAGYLRSCLVPYFVQHVYKLCTPNTWCLPSPLCRRHLSVRDRSKGGFCCQKTPAWSQPN